jgi:hypothetical protein
MKILCASLLSVFLATTARGATECIVIPGAPTLGVDAPFNATAGQFSPDEVISSLQVKFDTDSGIFAGTTDDVWLDLGPRAWKVGSDFPAGSSKSFNVTVNNDYFSAPNGPPSPLRVRDIGYVRIEKKGICGITDAPDSLFDPASFLPSAEAEIEKAQKALSEAGKLIDLHRQAIKAEQEAIDAAAKANQDFLNKKADAEKQLLDLNVSIQQKQLDLQNGVIKKLEDVAEDTERTVCDKLAVVIFGPAACIISHVVHETHIVQHVTKAWSDAQQFIIDRQRDVSGVAKAVVDFEASAEGAAASKLAHQATLGQLLADNSAETALNAASAVLDAAKKYAADLDDLVKKALAGLQVPLPGQWHLGHVSVAVNGKMIADVSVGKWLKRNDSSYVYLLGHGAPKEQFLAGLRASINAQSGVWDQLVAGLTTTFFKDFGISGWQGRPLASATVIGTLCHPPSPGTDRFVSLDLEVEEVEARGRVFKIERAATRFIRVEYVNGADFRYRSWSPGTRLMVEGPVLWDTDQYGFYELHPARASQVREASLTETLTSVPDLATAIARLGWWFVRLRDPK